jgi:hypothetical protein
MIARVARPNFANLLLGFLLLLNIDFAAIDFAEGLINIEVFDFPSLAQCGHHQRHHSWRFNIRLDFRAISANEHGITGCWRLVDI